MNNVLKKIIIRLAAEAPTEEEAQSLVNRVLEVLSPGA